MQTLQAWFHTLGCERIYNQRRPHKVHVHEHRLKKTLYLRSAHPIAIKEVTCTMTFFYLILDRVCLINDVRKDVMEIEPGVLFVLSLCVFAGVFCVFKRGRCRSPCNYTDFTRLVPRSNNGGSFFIIPPFLQCCASDPFIAVSLVKTLPRVQAHVIRRAHVPLLSLMWS